MTADLDPVPVLFAMVAAQLADDPDGVRVLVDDLTEVDARVALRLLVAGTAVALRRGADVDDLRVELRRGLLDLAQHGPDDPPRPVTNV